ncbi:thiamine-phosphate kinase [Sneathiella limimaris]|uniref:thiamine-phosphate kinase n=1 Tax=Sneathiella limimaris TaxID=1964213 RepID=UPI00146F4E78|nr:thiamine-phosphate kinase [Sneathiella limimaris]
MVSGSNTFGEFDLIKTLFAPLSAEAEGAFSLTDDAAVFSPAPGMDVVLTKDAMVEGVHYLGGNDPFDIARKLLRVNISDIAAMCAIPKGYLLAITLTEAATESWLRRFADGLKSDQLKYGITLLGGDTVSSPGPMVLSLTMLGEAPKGSVLRRNGAHPGDLICVSGTLGDAALGLLSSLGRLEVFDSDKEFLEGRYVLPQPRNLLGPALKGVANSCLDVSDGLLADIGHLCVQSNTGALIERAKIPLSDAARRVIQSNSSFWQNIVSGGDDYELVFTIPDTQRSQLIEIEEKTGVMITVVGKMTEEEGVHLIDEDGSKIPVATKGWTHR